MIKATEPITPIGPNLLIKKSDPETTTAGGLHIPETAQKPINKGVVVAVGRGYTAKNGTLVPCECQKGETVYWSKFQGTEVELNGEKFWLVREDDVVGRLVE